MPLFTLSPDDYDKKATRSFRSAQNESRAGGSRNLIPSPAQSTSNSSMRPIPGHSVVIQPSDSGGVILDGKYLLFPKHSRPTSPTPGPSRSRYAPTHPYAPANTDDPGAPGIGDRQCPDPTFDLEASLRSPASSTSTLLEPEAWERPKVEDPEKIHETLMQHGIIKWWACISSSKWLIWRSMSDGSI
ncbi:hypothetical protein BDP27DRAFT_1369320 [Rhodocollybia butyracea]|uniref:Uncharacterized protein n=1 Tax=Rhodocollybia butyracea TaxID=206335 RepID=A0A9P5U0Z7_9AGAR|nr:hypothetical protein BDP27DRAFT_1369320 [Rhodocollybia butyracea]